MSERLSVPFLVALLAGPALAFQDPNSAPVLNLPAQARGVGAVHSSGQTFITWAENTLLESESYKIYRSLDKIYDVRDPGVNDLGQRTWEDSGEYYAGRVVDPLRPCEAGVLDCGRPQKPLPCFRPRYVERLWIPTGVPAAPVREVQDDEGLLVWTPGCQGFPLGLCEGWAWYAVTTVDPQGVENPIVTSENRVRVHERVEDPSPVEIPRSYLDCSSAKYCPHDNQGDPNPVPPGVHVLFQYMDLKDWNPTFAAPNYMNCWWGEDPTERRIQSGRQSAFAYVVSEPDPAFGPCTGPTPVVMDLHHWANDGLEQAWGTGGVSAYAPGGCALKVMPIDVGDSWWYGFSSSHDYRLPIQLCPGSCDQLNSEFPPPAPYRYTPRTGPIVNYTEARVLRMLYDLMRHPVGGYTVDANRVYAQGSSMGAAGALQLATRYPDIFAACAVAKAMTDYQDYLELPPVPPELSDLRYQLPQLWGAWPAFAAGNSLPLLTVRNSGPGDWSQHLKPFNGTVVWDWMDVSEQVKTPARLAMDNAPFGVAAGFIDTTLPYPTQGAPFFTAFANLGRTWGGKIGCGGHGGPLYGGMPKSLTLSASNPSPAPFSDYNVVRDESVPGFSNLTTYTPAPTLCCNSCAVPGPYYYYDDVVWSSTWNDWDVPPVDVSNRWEISLKWTGSFTPPPVVDLTPRRVQQFVVDPAFQYSWMNVEIGTGAVIQPASAPLSTPAGVPLLRLKGVLLTPAGNRITVVRLP